MAPSSKLPCIKCIRERCGTFWAKLATLWKRKRERACVQMSKGRDREISRVFSLRGGPMGLTLEPWELRAKPLFPYFTTWTLFSPCAYLMHVIHAFFTLQLAMAKVSNEISSSMHEISPCPFNYASHMPRDLSHEATIQFSCIRS